MTESSVNEFNKKLNAAKEQIKQIEHVISNHPTVSQVNDTKAQTERIKSQLDSARSSLTVDRQPLINAKMNYKIVLIVILIYKE